MLRFILPTAMARSAQLSLMGLALSLPLTAASSTGCQAHSPLTALPVVELYTSEGCSSCPAADNWISKLRHDPNVVALSFHVDYWDYLGWKDHFAQALFSQRQREQLKVNGARYPYTPQVVINGIDAPRWHQQPSTAVLSTVAKASPVSLQLRKDGNQYLATVLGLSNAPAQLAAYWAVTEGPQKTSVKAGENRGEILSHDFIVRELQPVAIWAAGSGGQHHLNFSPTTTRLDSSLTRQVNLVVVDVHTGRPLQAIKLGC